MISHILPINEKSDLKQLIKLIPSEYLSRSVAAQIEERISSKVRTIVVEYPYVDKDYRSTYYGFYSKRHRQYDKFCFRLHLFGRTFQDSSELGRVAEAYLGSIVLRPTEVTPLGRTLLSPDAIEGFKGFVCESSFKNNLMGIPLEVNAFPHIMQDTDVTVCAHAVCWMIARYYSEKDSAYPERLSFDIVQAVTDLSAGRIIPSKGLTLGQVSEIFSSIGFCPEVFVRQLYPDQEVFYDILHSYVESGLPVVGALGGKQHAVAIFGHGPLKSARNIADQTDRPLINSRACCDHLIINDDNRLPYQTIGSNQTSAGNSTLHSMADLDAFVVPLYEKMYLNAENVLSLYPKMVASNIVTAPEGRHVFRIFMTSSRSYKRFLVNCDSIDDALRKPQLELPMPKFIWIMETSSPENFDAMKTEFRWIIDATANQYERFPFLLLHDKQKALVNDRALKGNLYRLEFREEITPYSIYENNLRRYS